MLSVTIGSTTYSIPTNGEKSWADTLDAFLQAVAAGINAAATKTQAAPAILCFGNSASASSDTAGVFLQPGFVATVPGSTNTGWPLPFACKISNLRVHLATTWSSSAGQGVFSLLKNGADAHLAATLQHGQQDASNTGTSSLSFAAGDYVGVGLTTSGSTNAAMGEILVTCELTLA